MGVTLKLLLDTHTLLWWWGADTRLSKRAIKAIADESNTVLVSAASAWEIAIKFRLGKLPGAERAIGEFNALLMVDRFEHLTMTAQHALKAGGFEADHRDPFDCMLAAQALIESATLVTDDASMKLFRAKCLW
jgi:PIN domain nuclease of toxin-antitoxin system